MKKLMIAAAAAAMVGSGFADAPQVYDMTITVKSTECVNKIYKNVCAEGVGYRKQATTKFYGKFWGCGCCTIAEPDGNVGYGQDLSDGAYDTDFHSYIFWGKGAAFHNATMVWGPDIDGVKLANLQLVGQKATNIEGAFKLELFTCADVENGDDASAVFFGAGYGTATVKGCADDDNILKSMSGNVIGSYDVGQLSGVNGCKYCGEATACAPWDFCSCSAANDALTAAFGTFTIKYNSSQANSLKKGKYISDLMKSNKLVIDEFACIAADGDDDDDDDEVDEKAEAIKAYKAAKEAYDTAVATETDLKKGATECTEGKKLAADADAANTVLKNAKDNEQTAWDALASNKSVQDAAGKLQTAKDELAAVKADEASSAKKIADAEKAVEDAEKALNVAYDDVPGNKLADVKAAVVTYQDAYAARISAAEKSTAANKAVEGWNKTGYAAATTQADADVKTALTKMQIAQVNCQTKGGAADCE